MIWVFNHTVCVYHLTHYNKSWRIHWGHSHITYILCTSKASNSIQYIDWWMLTDKINARLVVFKVLVCLLPLLRKILWKNYLLTYPLNTYFNGTVKSLMKFFSRIQSKHLHLKSKWILSVHHDGNKESSWVSDNTYYQQKSQVLSNLRSL